MWSSYDGCKTSLVRFPQYALWKSKAMINTFKFTSAHCRLDQVYTRLEISPRRLHHQRRHALLATRNIIKYSQSLDKLG